MHGTVIRGGTIIDGYRATFVSGVPVFEEGHFTGKLVRARGT